MSYAEGQNIEMKISLWSMRPSGDTAGEAWEAGCRKGWEWAIEECARVVETYKSYWQPVPTEHAEIVAAIRALKDKP